MRSRADLLMDILALPTAHPLKRAELWTRQSEPCQYLEAIPEGSFYLGAFHSEAFTGACHFGTIDDAAFVGVPHGDVGIRVYYSMRELGPRHVRAKPGDVTVNKVTGHRNYYYKNGPYFEVACSEYWVCTWTDQDLYNSDNWRFVIDLDKYDLIGNFLKEQ